MEREEFTRVTAGMPDVVNPKYMDTVMNASAAALKGNTPGTANLIIAMEEYAEAQKEISKFLRGQGNRDDLLQELADASLSTKWAQKVVGITDSELNRAINAKLKRQADKVGLPGPSVTKAPDLSAVWNDQTLSQETRNARDKIDGELNRVMVTDSVQEIKNMYSHLQRNIWKLMCMAKERIRRQEIVKAQTSAQPQTMPVKDLSADIGQIVIFPGRDRSGMIVGVKGEKYAVDCGGDDCELTDPQDVEVLPFK